MEGPSMPELLRLIECPVCTEAMAPPIEMCANGHSVCGSCRKGVTVCPVCRGALVGPRNRVAEDLSERLLGRTCENSARGCTVRLTSAAALSKHQLTCAQRAHQCIQCPKVILSAKDVPTHYLNVHKVSVLKSSIVELELNTDLDNSRTFMYLVDVADELLCGWLLARGNVVLFGMSLCASTGPSFSFELSIKSSDGAKMEYSGPVHTSADHRVVQMNLKPCEKCVSLTRKFAQGAVTSTVRISRN